jgi:hypothetical protein
VCVCCESARALAHVCGMIVNARKLDGDHSINIAFDKYIHAPYQTRVCLYKSHSTRTLKGVSKIGLVGRSVGRSVTPIAIAIAMDY